MRPKARAGPTRRPARPPGRECPGRVLFCPWRTVLVACPDRPRNLTRFGAYLFLNVHKTPSWATSRNKGMAWYSGRPMPSLWLWIWSSDTECKNLTVYALPHKQTSPTPPPPFITHCIVHTSTYSQGEGEGWTGENAAELSLWSKYLRHDDKSIGLFLHPWHKRWLFFGFFLHCAAASYKISKIISGKP
jgi:hypothetical protein